jgi:putative salt-induced outer membrane protein YdiY
VCVLLGPLSADAQPVPPPPPPLWDSQLGAAFVGTSGNTDTSTFGADFIAHRRWPVWQIEATAAMVQASDEEETTAERYLATFRALRRLTSYVSLTAGEKAERDRLAGMDYRNILDGGLAWVLLRQPRWTLDGITSLAWNHEAPVIGSPSDSTAGVFQLLSKVPFSATADTTQRFTYYPNFSDASAYRSEAEITAQAAMTRRLALKFGYLWRYSNLPVFGFEKTDNTTTASIVLRWESATLTTP